MRIEGGVMTVREEARTEDSGQEADERCMLLLKKIGNAMHKSIQIEVDYPLRHQDRKLPILDFKVWIENRCIRVRTVNDIITSFTLKKCHQS